MSFILYVSKINKPKDEIIKRIIDIHQTPHDEVTVTYVDEKLENGFKIERIDRPAQIKKEPDLKDYLNIKSYKFQTRITAKENEEKVKNDQKNKLQQ